MDRHVGTNRPNRYPPAEGQTCCGDLDFFRDMEKEMKEGHKPTFRTENGISASKTIASLEPVGREWMEMWLRQWEF